MRLLSYRDDVPGKTVDPLSSYEDQRLIVDGDGAQRRARHPNVPFSFSLPEGAEVDHETETAAAEKLAGQWGRGYFFVTRTVSMNVMVSTGLPDTDGFTRGALKTLDDEERQRIRRSGSGNELDLRFTVSHDGDRVWSRVIFVPGRGDRIHGVIMHVAADDPDVVRALIDSLRRDRDFA